MISKKTFKALERTKYLAAATPLKMKTQGQCIEFYSGGTATDYNLASVGMAI